MLALTCCNKRCTDLRSANWFDGLSFYPHSGFWECTDYRRRTLKPRRSSKTSSSSSSSATAVAVDPFYDSFRRLPFEMKIMCLSYCKLHVLANPELWLRDVDRLFYKRLMQDDHVSKPPCSLCNNIQALDLNVKQRSLYVSAVGYYEPYVLLPYKNLTNGIRTLCDTKISRWFGNVNRYPCFYYRRCAHFDQCWAVRRVRDARECWTRLNRTVGSPEPLSETAINLLEKTPAVRWRYLNDTNSPVFACSRVPFTTVAPINTTVGPGMYYFELINYQWEEAISAIDGELSRQRHFFVDPADPSHASSESHFSYRSGYGRFPMSLLLRRVCHPDREIDDRYTTIAYFEPNKRGVPPTASAEISRTDVYFDFQPKSIADLVDDEEIMTPAVEVEQETRYFPYDSSFNYLRSYRVMVYRHVLAPTFDIQLVKCVDPRKHKNVSYYRASFPPNVTLHSLDRNEHTTRVNFYVDIEKMTQEQKAFYGAALVSAVKSKTDLSYAFMDLRPTDGMFNTLESVAVFNQFYDCT